MTYLDFFELNQEPFSNAPVSRFYYNSAQHSQALVRLMHAVQNMKGLALLIGDIGAGKTTLARRMLDSLPESEYEAALLVIIHSGITANWLLRRIALQLGVESPAQEKLALLSQLYQRLLQIHEAGKKAVVLIGDIGAGKTTLARRMLDSLPEEEYEAALLVIIHSGITANWLLRRIALQLGVESPAQEKLALLSQLYQRLLQIHEAGKKAVVLIDEAQMLETREIMEEFRGLLNLEVPERKLISFVFFGLPEIETNLKLDPPLAQRVALRYKLEPFTSESTEAYIKHRLRLAGCPKMPFSPEAISAVHKHSGGSPRVINTLCDNALFEAFLARTDTISGEMLDKIGTNLGLHRAGDKHVKVEEPRRIADKTRQPSGKIDLAEIDRYLEGLGKL